MKAVKLLTVTFITLISYTLSAQDLNTNFSVFSDPHYYDTSLGTEGEAFEDYLSNDRKLLIESKELLGEAINIIRNSNSEFVIVPGDLTKDGTLISHTRFAEMMNELEEDGIEVYVVPGNHDVSNGESMSYRGTDKVRVDNVNPVKFEEIYSELGYGQALYRDPNSLSYIAEPDDGLWLFALDACLYKKNDPEHHPVTDGEFSKKTLEWIEEMAQKANEENKEIIAMMHHGVLQHYKKQNKFFGDYIVNNNNKVAKIFAKKNIHFVFTGHYHSQDITLKEWNDGSFIYDIETGSLVTYPCPVRTVSIKQGTMQISSTYITNLPSKKEGFEEYSRKYAHEGIASIAEEIMVSMHLKREEAQKLSGQIGDAVIAHYHGDEVVPEYRYLNLEGIGLLGKLMILTKRRLIVELYNDLPPVDNNIGIDMETGEYVLPE